MRISGFVRALILVGAIVLLAALIAGGIVLYRVNWRTATVDTASSPDGKYEVILQSVGEPDFPYGATHAKLVLKEGSRIIASEKADILDDGAALTAENWAVEWQDSCAVVTIRGSEQADAVYTLCFDGTVTAEITD